MSGQGPNFRTPRLGTHPLATNNNVLQIQIRHDMNQEIERQRADNVVHLQALS